MTTPPRQSDAGAAGPVVAKTTLATAPATPTDGAPVARAAPGEIIARACAARASGAPVGVIASALKNLVEHRRQSMVTQYARGDIAAARFSEFMSECLAALYGAGAEDHPAAARGLAVAAVGGFGRGELAPYSDIDLLFLHQGDEAMIRPLLDFMLYPLWDAGIKVGHAVHAPGPAANFARGDIIARTAYLDARLLCGPSAPYADFQKRFERLRRSGRKPFSDAKREEMAARHERAEQSRYLAEPDVKEGRGGLRDLHTMAWLHRYEFDRDIAGGKSQKSIFGPEDLRALKRCERLLWSVRVQLHGLRGRADEKLSFDIQPALAERLGYVDRGGMNAAERLMRDYFVNAMEVGRLTRIFFAKLEEERSRLSPRAFKLLPKALASDEAGAKANLKLAFGLLTFESAAKAKRAPLDLVRLFRAYSKRPDIDIHPDALAIVSGAVGALTPDMRGDPYIAKVFVAMLTESKDPAGALRLMAETGLLGKYIPSLGKIIGRIEYGLYRRYSVDENVFQSISVLHEIESGAAADRHPIASAILARTDDRAEFYLAVLLHETSWSMRDASVEACEKLVARIARRLGQDEEAAARVGWAAARRTLMVRTVERRNLSEPLAIARFAEMVEDQRRLDLLLVLSVCHLRTVGVQSWDEWMRRQLTELYHAATAFLAGGEAGLAARLKERAAAARSATRALLTDWTEGERDEALARLSDEAFRVFDANVVARICELESAAKESGDTAAVFMRQRGADVEAIICADDRTGLLADLAGAISTAGVSVRDVRGLTTADGKAIDVFTIQTIDGGPLDDPELVGRLRARLTDAARIAPARRPTPARRIGDRRAIFEVTPAVRLDQDASIDCTVVEAEGRDRPGLLYALASGLADLGVAIRSAQIATYGERAVDTFYLQDGPGRKITDPKRLKAIERALLDVLSAGEPARRPLTQKP